MLIGAAVVIAVLALGAAIAGLVGAGSTDTAERADRSEIALTVATAEAGRCVEPTSETVRNADLAFEGVVVESTADEVVLDPGRWYFGGDSDRVRLDVASPDGSPLRLHGQPQFRVGERWIVSATDGRVNSCGFTAPWSAEAAAAYGG